MGNQPVKNVRHLELLKSAHRGFGGRGLGTRLMLSIMDVAREKGLSEIEGLVLTKNPGMLKLMRSLGYTVKPFSEDPDFKLVTHTL